jgi:ribosomal protein S18 acetylase RimI-like enzyme
MAHLQSHAVAQGFSRVFLETPGPNERAIRVYQRLVPVAHSESLGYGHE